MNKKLEEFQLCKSTKLLDLFLRIRFGYNYSKTALILQDIRLTVTKEALGLCNHMFDREIWVKLPERIFENFEIARG